jgi:hypothetical protein
VGAARGGDVQIGGDALRQQGAPRQQGALLCGTPDKLVARGAEPLLVCWGPVQSSGHAAFGQFGSC